MCIKWQDFYIYCHVKFYGALLHSIIKSAPAFTCNLLRFVHQECMLACDWMSCHESQESKKKHHMDIVANYRVN